ncbi:MAG TPA: hypothetical protein VFX27_04125 [Sphingobium sp.]|nr:hypothetical protein [Sphingobium sp.]
MAFWKPIPADEAARLKQRYEELGSLQALADEENVRTGWLGQVLLRHDRRVAGSDTHYTGPERRKRGQEE